MIKIHDEIIQSARFLNCWKNSIWSWAMEIMESLKYIVHIKKISGDAKTLWQNLNTENLKLTVSHFSAWQRCFSVLPLCKVSCCFQIFQNWSYWSLMSVEFGSSRPVLFGSFSGEELRTYILKVLHFKSNSRSQYSEFLTIDINIHR